MSLPLLFLWLRLLRIVWTLPFSWSLSMNYYYSQMVIHFYKSFKNPLTVKDEFNWINAYNPPILFPIFRNQIIITDNVTKHHSSSLIQATSNKALDPWPSGKYTDKEYLHLILRRILIKLIFYRNNLNRYHCYFPVPLGIIVKTVFTLFQDQNGGDLAIWRKFTMRSSL